MNLFKKKKKNRVAVFSIDGIPYSFIEKMVGKGRLPNLGLLFKSGKCRQMNSVYPTISSVAWSSFMTGVNPASHNIFGFIDREPDPFEMYIPTSRTMKVKTLWEYLSDAGKRVVVINVPVTYPPRQVNGVLISGFLATKIDKAVYPPEYAEKLKTWDYRIDVDSWLGRTDKEKFMDDLYLTLKRRCITGFRLLKSEDWDYYHLHIMESDRISHFLWEQWEQGDPVWAKRFEDFFEEIDQRLGEFRALLPDGVKMVVMSDHGFCSIKKEVYVNKWLTENGYLKFTKEKPESLNEISSETKAYSLIPGRIYINLKGREWAGTIFQGEEYQAICNEIQSEIREMTDPETGEKIIDKVFLRKDIYKGAFMHRAADIFVIPKDGYDLKGNLTADSLTFKGDLVGMHTYGDAFLYMDGVKPGSRKPEIIDVLPTIFDLLNVSIPKSVEGVSLLG